MRLPSLACSQKSGTFWPKKLKLLDLRARPPKATPRERSIWKLPGLGVFWGFVCAQISQDIHIAHVSPTCTFPQFILFSLCFPELGNLFTDHALTVLACVHVAYKSKTFVKIVHGIRSVQQCMNDTSSRTVCLHTHFNYFTVEVWGLTVRIACEAPLERLGGALQGGTLDGSDPISTKCT